MENDTVLVRSKTIMESNFSSKIASTYNYYISDLQTAATIRRFLTTRLNPKVLLRDIRFWTGLAAATFLGYCVYFDWKRRSHPDYRRKVRERRKTGTKRKNRLSLDSLPDPADREDVKRFFLEEVERGEELLAAGDIHAGVDHLTLALAVCGQPRSLLGVLQVTLPPKIYRLLLQNLARGSLEVGEVD